MNRVGGPIVAKATDNEEWLKVLRSVEKQRRRRERIRNKPSEKGARGDEDGGTGRKEEKGCCLVLSQSGES